jgi:hypothetical protein
MKKVMSCKELNNHLRVVFERYRKHFRLHHKISASQATESQKGSERHSSVGGSSSSKSKRRTSLSVSAKSERKSVERKSVSAKSESGN